MNTSTEGVSILSALLFDILEEYRGVEKLCAPAFAMTEGLDRSRPDSFCPMETYNAVCNWIELHVGSSSVRRAGVAVGGRIYARMVAEKRVSGKEPLQMMEALAWAARTMIRDPLARGFEITASSPTSIEMRRTQTFNCILQEGLILALVEKTGVLMPSVRHVRCTRREDEFCDYEIRWLRQRDVKSRSAVP